MRGGWLERLLPWWVDPDPAGRTFDRTYGTETRWFDLGNYEPSPPGVVNEVLGAFPVPLEGRTFVDLGSGKGRVVLLASRFPFARVVGIEHRPGLHAIALANRAAYEASAGPGAAVHFLCGDAAEQPLPDGPLVVWMFNPFGADVVAAVGERLRGREAHLVYAWPKHLLALQAQGFRAIGSGERDDCPWTVLVRP